MAAIRIKLEYIWLSCILLGYTALFLTGSYTTENQVTICPVKNITGYPCPGCGMGRASFFFWQGHFQEAFYWHWLAIPFNLLIPVAIIWMVYDLIKGKRTFLAYTRKPMSTGLTIVSIILILANWIKSLVIGL